MNYPRSALARKAPTTLQHSNVPASCLIIAIRFSDFRIQPSEFRLALPLVRIQDVAKAIPHQVKPHDND